MFFHDLVTAFDGGGIFEHTTLQRFDIAIDQSERRTQFMGSIGDEVLSDLFCHGLLSDVMHHEPSTAFRFGRQRGGLDEVMSASDAAAAQRRELHFTHDTPLVFERTLDDVDDLVILDLFKKSTLLSILF